MNHLDKIQKKLKDQDLCFGTHCSNTELEFYEMCGYLGYDYVWIDSEHASVTFPMLKNAIIATNAGGASAFVRIPDHQMCHAKPVLECGPDGIIFPMVNTADEARQCVSICTYPPEGTRGFGPLRALDYGTLSLSEYVEIADDRLLKLMQCEHVEAVKNLDSILEVEGVDGIICGPMDLAASIGKMCDYYEPEVMDLMQQIIDKCKAHNKPFGLSIGNDMKLVEFWIQQGASFLSMGTPIDYFREMSKEVIVQARKLKEK